MTQFFLQFAQVGLVTSLLGVLFTICSLWLNRRYSAGLRRWVWLVLALRLLAPFVLPLPMQPALQLSLPGRAAAPLTSVEREPSVSIETPQAEPSSSSAIKGNTAPAVGPESRQSPAQASGGLSLLQWAVVVWLGIAAVLLVGGAARFWLWCRGTMRFARPLGAEGERVYQRAAVAAGWPQSKLPPIYRCVAVDTPMAVGLVRPVLLVPEREFSEEQLYVILLHELTHLRGGDLWQQGAWWLAAVLHWYNPAVWLLRRQACEDMELACDERVLALRGGPSPLLYSRVLLAAAGPAGPCLFGAPFGAGEKLLRRRLGAAFGAAKRKKGRALLAGMVCAALLGAGFVACKAPAPSSAVPTAGGAFSSPQEEGALWPVLPQQGELRVQGPEGAEEQTLSEHDFAGSASWRQLMDYLKSGPQTHPQPGYYLQQEDRYRLAALTGTPGEELFVCTAPNTASGKSEATGTLLRWEEFGQGEETTLPGLMPMGEDACVLVIREQDEPLRYSTHFYRLPLGQDGSPRTEEVTHQVLETDLWRRPESVGFLDEANGYLALSQHLSCPTGESELAQAGYMPLPLVMATMDGGKTWRELDFSEVLQEAPYEGYRAERVVIQGNTAEIQCGTGPESSETLYLVTQDKGAAWKWQ